MQDHARLWTELGLDVALCRELTESGARRYRRMILSQTRRPTHMDYFDRMVAEAHGGRVEEIVEARRAGAKLLGTFCIYVPEELVLAAGAISVALCGGTAFSIPYAEKRFPRDICPLIKSTLGLAFSRTCPYGPIEDLAVGETTCDAKKKTWDVLSKKTNFHVLELPQKKTDQARALWLTEVRAFKDRLEALTGTRIETEALGLGIRLLNRKRLLLAELAELRSAAAPPISGKDALVVMQVALMDEPRRFCAELASLLEELRVRVRQGVSPFGPDAPRLMVTGCPSVMGNYKLHDIIESSGAVVVADESCTGTRYFTGLVTEGAATLDEQLKAIASRYMSIDCACFSPNDERIERVVELAGRHRVDAVVQYTLQYCHAYNIEAMRIAGAMKRAGAPTLEVVTDYAEEDSGQLRTRVEALLERIR